MKLLVILPTIFIISTFFAVNTHSQEDGPKPVWKTKENHTAAETTVVQGREYDNPALPVETATGKYFTLILASNPTTGFRWELQPGFDKTVVEAESNTYRPPNTPPGMTGAGGKEAWTFRAAGKGSTTISLVYRRSWEKGIPPAKTASFIIHVR